jgi:hypothetical protein
MAWISKEQQERDHKGLRDVCAADGRDGSTKDPLGLTDTGSRIHERHFTDPGNGWFGRKQ